MTINLTPLVGVGAAPGPDAAGPALDVTAALAPAGIALAVLVVLAVVILLLAVQSRQPATISAARRERTMHGLVIGAARTIAGTLVAALAFGAPAARAHGVADHPQ